MVARRVPPRSLRGVHARLVEQGHLLLPHRLGLPALQMQMQMQVQVSMSRDARGQPCPAGCVLAYTQSAICACSLVGSQG